MLGWLAETEAKTLARDLGAIPPVRFSRRGTDL
jgi:hypothetical protein